MEFSCKMEISFHSSAESFTRPFLSSWSGNQLVIAILSFESFTAVEHDFTIVTTVLLQLAYVDNVCHVVCIHDSRQTVTNTPYDREWHTLYRLLRFCNREKHHQLATQHRFLIRNQLLHKVHTCNVFATSPWCMFDGNALRYPRRTASH